MNVNTRRHAESCSPDVLRRKLKNAINTVNYDAGDPSHPYSAGAHGTVEAMHGVSKRERSVLQAFIAVFVERSDVEGRAFGVDSSLMDRVLLGMNGVAGL